MLLLATAAATTATVTAAAAATTTDHLIRATEAGAQEYVNSQGTQMPYLAKAVLIASNARSGVPIPEKWVVYVRAWHNMELCRQLRPNKF